jgi:uncharacterized protein (DUF427 family)
VEPVRRRIRVLFNNVTVVDTNRAHRVLETSHPPVYYIPREDILPGCLEASAVTSYCEFKGRAQYWNLRVGSRMSANAAWSYASPVRGFEAIQGAVAFYASRVDECYVDDERVKPQPGNFYGGWITSDVEGPFKGEPGSEGW